MKTRILYLFATIFSKFISKKQVGSLIKVLAHKNHIDLLLFTYNSIGILNFTDENSGEYFFINNLLSDSYSSKEKLIFFDVGANIGNYSRILANRFPQAKIVAFEPTSEPFQILLKNTEGLNILPINKGLGSINETRKIYTSKDSEHNTMHKEVLQKFLIKENIQEEEIVITTIDSYCKEHFIQFIDFLKIDVEGYELFVLKGALNMITDKKIHVIQFEFNEMNIISRVFLKDFYDLLFEYDFYRIGKHGLVPILKYNSINEIFQFQNIVAILK